MVHLVVGEEAAQDREFCKAGPAVDAFRICTLDQAAKNIDFAFFQANIVLDGSRADHGLRDAAYVRIAGVRRNLDAQLKADLVVRMHARGDVDVDSDVQVRELRIDQRVYKARAARAANTHASLKAARRDGNALADFQLGRLAIHGANFRVLNNFCIGIS